MKCVALKLRFIVIHTCYYANVMEFVVTGSKHMGTLSYCSFYPILTDVEQSFLSFQI